VERGEEGSGPFGRVRERGPLTVRFSLRQGELISNSYLFFWIENSCHEAYFFQVSNNPSKKHDFFLLARSLGRYFYNC
jgi:hypothetical protein